jgi:hypothetical protein
MKTLHLPDEFKNLAQQHFVLLEPENIAKQRDTVQIRLSGYSDVSHLIGDIVKTCILAMGDGNTHSTSHIPSPESNISGVLSIILDLLPYEESDLLDMIRREVLDPQSHTGEETDWDFVLATISLIEPQTPECQPKS